VTRLVLLSLVLVSLTAAVTGSLAFIRARRALEKEAHQRLEMAALSIGDHLQREIEDRWSDLSNWTRLDVMRALLYGDVDKQLAQFLDHMLRDRPIYRSIVCLDTHGTEVAAAGTDAPSVLAAPGRSAVLSVVRSTDGERRPLLRLDLAVPHPDRPNESAGWLVAFVDPGRLVDAAADLTRPAGRDVGLALAVVGGAELARAGAEKASEEVGDGLAASRRLGPFADLSGVDLEVRVEEPRAAALAPLRSARDALWKIAALALAIGSALGALLAWRIATPIRQLTAAARAISERGHYDGDLRLPAAAGEVGVLSRAFRRMLESLNAAQAQAVAQARLAFLGDVAANIAHEVRTPLSVLKTSAQLIARPGLATAERERLAANVTAEVDRLNGIVTDLVDLARPRPVRYRHEAVPDIIERALRFFAAMARQAGVRITYQRPADTCPVNASGDQLYQVLLNLIRNALQAMSGPGELTIGCRREGQWVVVECADDGPGIAPDLLPRLFSRFCSSKPDGAGLGLAIACRIVEEHGGSISADNLPGGGARFTVRLPSQAEVA
jgi:two-component system, NtrC family, sensor histidine kinase HydH